MTSRYKNYSSNCECVCAIKGERGFPGQTGPAGPRGFQGPQGTPGTIITFGPDGSLLRSNSTNPLGYDFVGNINIPPGTDAFLGENSGNPSNPPAPRANTGFGQNTLAVIDNGNSNTAIGFDSLFSNTNGSLNTAIGRGALRDAVNASSNTAIGYLVLSVNTSGSSNTAVGSVAMTNNTLGGNNVAVGANALDSNTIGNNNVAIGNAALATSSIGDGNTGVGFSALVSLQTGSQNTVLGNNAGSALISGSDNLLLGANAQVSGNQSGNIVIGSITSTAVSNRTFIAQVHDQVVGLDERPVYINENNLLGTQPPSSIIFKENVNSMQDDISTKLLALNPITFTYKNDNRHKLQYGLIAEEVVEILPELVYMKKADDEFKPNGVNYEKFIPMLIYQAQKQNKEIEILKNARVADQLQIQKQNEEIEILKSKVSELQMK